MDRGAWRAAVHRVAKSQTCLSHPGLLSKAPKVRQCVWETRQVWGSAHPRHQVSMGVSESLL